MPYYVYSGNPFCEKWAWGSRVVASPAAFDTRVGGSIPGLGGLKETKCFFPIHV